MPASRKLIWKTGEAKAVRYLEKLGYTIAERNYRTRFGEIDIIAWNQQMLTFIEVKTRASDDLGPPELTVTHRKIKKIKRVAEHYIRCKSLNSSGTRFSFEVLAVKLQGDSLKIRHYKELLFD